MTGITEPAGSLSSPSRRKDSPARPYSNPTTLCGT